MYTKKSQQISWLGSLMTLSLLLIYVASSIRLDSIHQLFHAENITELHSVEKETNPCHRNIYHQQNGKGCEHKSHLTQNSKCPFCEHSTNSKTILTEQIELSSHLQQTDLGVCFQEGDHSFFNAQSTGRSPPQV